MDERKKQEFLEEATHWLVLTMVHDPRLLAAKGAMDAHRENSDVVALAQQGCKTDVLLNTFAFASALPHCYPGFTAEDLRELAKDSRSVLRRMKSLTPSFALPWLGADEDDEAAITFQPTGGDMHVWGCLEETIVKKANCYDSLAELCKEKLLPTRATLGKLSYLWPLIYVRACTKEPNYARVSRILDLSGIDKNEKQLRVGLEGALKKHESILGWMTLAAGMLTDTSSYLGPIPYSGTSRHSCR
jgi:hypothetical protein